LFVSQSEDKGRTEDRISTRHSVRLYWQWLVNTGNTRICRLDYFISSVKLTEEKKALLSSDDHTTHTGSSDAMNLASQNFYKW